MAGLLLFNRRWNISSDDFFFPGLIELILRSIWLIIQLLLFAKNGSIFTCKNVSLLNVYFIGFVVLMSTIIVTELMIVIVSTRGTISNSIPRKRINIFLYMRILLIIFELIWNCVGIVWWVNAKTDFSNCPKSVYFTVLANIIFCFTAVLAINLILIFVYDPISHLPQHDVTSKRAKLLDYITFLCCFCCMLKGNSRETSYENSYDQIGAILEFIFRGGDLTPSDITAGVLLLSNKENNQFNRENIQISRNRMPINNQQPAWMTINEASYYIKYATACYSWPYYVYINPCTGPCKFFCSKGKKSCFCCCCLRKTKYANALNDNICSCYYDAFKELSKTNDCDILHANFRNELFHAPFFVIHDHLKKSVVIAVRGTLSISDVITDMTAECGVLDLGSDVKDGKCHIGILNTAENIYKCIKDGLLLEKAFEFNQNYQLVVTGHSLGAGIAAILGLKLLKEYPNLKCICYSPPGGLMTKNLIEITKSFVLTVILGDDIVPRLSLRSIHSLKANILKEIHECEIPKYRIVFNTALNYLFSKENKNRKPFSQDSSLLADTGRNQCEPVSSRQTIIDLNESAYIEIAEDGVVNQDDDKLFFSKSQFVLHYSENYLRSALDTYEDLNLPGNILYIYDLESRSRRCYSLCKGTPSFDCRWANSEEFKKIIITRRMLIDHFPNTLHDALKYFKREGNI